jgi:diguanylate cyclase (GGDEF)-like protein
VHLDSRQLDQLFGTFFEITSLLHAGRDGEDIFARVLECGSDLLEADRCILLLAHEGRLLKFWRERGADSKLQSDELEVTPAVLAWLDRERQPYLGSAGEWRLPVPEQLMAVGSGSLVCAPLVAKESHLGLLVAVRGGRPGGFEAGHLKILTALANQTAIAIENADLYERLKQEAVTDGLTGVYNYKTLMQSLRTEMRRAQRYGHTVTFIMVDVDFLKRYNDRFGHMAGSEVLAHVARMLSANCRNTDIVGKYGGDEFAIILPQTSIEGAIHVAERMRAAIAQYEFANVEQGAITCSFGIATYPDDGREIHELIWQADQQLFQAKREGKNRLRATGRDGPVPDAAPAPAAVPGPRALPALEAPRVPTRSES